MIISIINQFYFYRESQNRQKETFSKNNDIVILILRSQLIGGSQYTNVTRSYLLHTVKKRGDIV